MDPDGTRDYDAEEYKLISCYSPLVRPHANTSRRGPVKKWVWYMILVVSVLIAISTIMFCFYVRSDPRSSKEASSFSFIHPTVHYGPVGPSAPFAPYPVPTGIAAEIQHLLDNPVAVPRTAVVVRERQVDILAYMDPGQTPDYHAAIVDDFCSIEPGGQLTEIAQDSITGYVLVKYAPPAGKTTYGVPCDGSNDPNNGDGEGIEAFYVPPGLLR
jgi:hypothetical protein